MNMQDAFSAAAAVIVSLGGGGAIIIALSGWLGKVWASRILEQDRRKYETELEHLKAQMEATNRAFQAEIDKTIFVHRAQFETEFAALKDIWQKMANLLRVMTLLHAGPGVVFTRARKEPFSEVDEALIAAHESVDDNWPFIPERIHAELLTALSRVKREDVRVVLDPENATPDQRQRAEGNFQALYQDVKRVVHSVRERLKSLAVVEKK